MTVFSVTATAAGATADEADEADAMASPPRGGLGAAQPPTAVEEAVPSSAPRRSGYR